MRNKVDYASLILGKKDILILFLFCPLQSETHFALHHLHGHVSSLELSTAVTQTTHSYFSPDPEVKSSAEFLLLYVLRLLQQFDLIYKWSCMLFYLILLVCQIC